MNTELKNIEVVVARRHPCGWCGETIQKDAIARYRVGVVDSDFYSVWEHPECYLAMRHSHMDGDVYDNYQQERGVEYTYD